MKDEYEKAFPGTFIMGHLIKGDWYLSKKWKLKAKKLKPKSK